jgi:hypothetical protein
MRGIKMSSTRTLVSLTSLSALLAACTGGGGSAGQQTPVITSASKGTGTIALSIKIPAKKTASSNVHHRQYVSPATQSLALTITQSGATVLQEAVSLATSNPNCTNSAGATTCTLSFPLAPGSYLGTVSTYDGAVVAGAASGHLLSQGQSLSITVVGGQTNDLTLTLDGVPASITIAPASGSQITGTQGSGFSVPFSAQPLLINALDADGNTIVGPGTPTFTAQVSPSTGFTLTQPTSGTPNQITLAATGSGGTATVSVAAAPPNSGFSCSSSGVVCVASAGVTSHLHTLFLAGLGAGLWLYTSPDNLTWTLATTNATHTFSEASSITMDSSNDVIVGDVSGFYGGGAIAVFAPPYSASPTVNTNFSNVNALAITASGTLLIADGQNFRTLTPPYTGTATSTAYSQIHSLAVDPSGNAIVSAEAFPGNTSSYAAPTFTQPTSINSSLGGEVAISSTGTLAIDNIYITQEVAVYAQPYSSSTPVLISLNSAPYGHLTFDSNGNIWLDLNNGHLEQFTAPFSAGESPAVNVASQFGINALSSDSSGDVLEAKGGSVYVISSTGTTLATITPSSTPTAMLYEK